MGLTPIRRQPGFAPDVTLVDGLLYLAYGVPGGCLLEVFTLEGALVRSVPLPGGFYNSFPRFSGPWLVYKRDVDWLTVAMNVRNGETHVFGVAGGNYPVVVNATLGLACWQAPPDYAITLGNLVNGASWMTGQLGAPDGLTALLDDYTVTLRKDVRSSVPGMVDPITAGELTVGKATIDPPQVLSQIAGDVLRVAFLGDSPSPSCATDGRSYALAVGGPGGIVALVGTIADLTALPPPAPPVRLPTFAFSHPVILAPFKADGSGAPDIFSLGDYSEAPTLPVLQPGRRLLLAHDALSDWTLPSGLRPYDVPLLEWYRDPSETLAQSTARWLRQTSALLVQWPGDLGGIPMFYDQLRWSVQDVLDGLTALSWLVNLSPRVKVIAPFAYNRANGIVAHPELLQAWARLEAAAAAAGVATLTPVETSPPPDDGKKKPPPDKKDPPPQKPPATLFPAARVYGSAR